LVIVGRNIPIQLTKSFPSATIIEGEIEEVLARMRIDANIANRVDSIIVVDSFEILKEVSKELKRITNDGKKQNKNIRVPPLIFFASGSDQVAYKYTNFLVSLGRIDKLEKLLIDQERRRKLSDEETLERAYKRKRRVPS
jgi:hypothetical protein